MTKYRTLSIALVAVLCLVAASGDDDDSADPGGGGSEQQGEDTGGTDGDGWRVDLANCPDPDAVTEPITGEIVVGLTAPLSGGAATAFVPSVRALEAYIDYANEQDLLDGITIRAEVRDDQFDPGQTPAAVNGLLDDGVHVISGISGTGSNLAVRSLLNEECVPQLNAFSGSPDFGDVETYPWTTGALVPYDVEVEAYAAEIERRHPDGATVASFAVNSDFGLVYSETLEHVADEYGLEVVESQTVEVSDSAAPTAQVNALAAAAPDAIVAVPLGAGCVSFLGEIANARAANAGWDPQVYLTSTCASALILGAAGEDADGVFSAANGALVDIGNPEVQAQPGPAEYIEYMRSKGLDDAVTTGAIGWTVAETTVEVLRQAAASSDGLTRESIINAARNLTYTPMLARPGATYKMSGVEDPFIVEAVQVISYDASAGIFDEVSEINTSFESS